MWIRSYICEVNGTDGRDCEPTTHLDTGNTCNTAPVEPAIYDLEGFTFHTNSYLDNLRMKYPRNFFIAHLNINNIRHKFYEIYDMLNGNGIDIFGISETKINASFTNAQFNIPGFKLHRQDKDLKGNGGGIIVYIKDSIPHRIVRKHSGITDGVEYMSFEVCFKKCKWFLVYVYKPPKVSDDCTWIVLSYLADCFVNNGNVTVFFGGINNDMFKDNVLCNLCDIYDLKNLVRSATCFKGETPTFLDVFLTNKLHSFCHYMNISILIYHLIRPMRLNAYTIIFRSDVDCYPRRPEQWE